MAQYDIEDITADIDTTLDPGGGTGSINPTTHRDMARRFPLEIGRWTGLHFKMLTAGTPTSGQVSMNSGQIRDLVEDDTITIASRDEFGTDVQDVIGSLPAGSLVAFRTHDARRFVFTVKSLANTAGEITLTIKPAPSNDDTAYTQTDGKSIVMDVMPQFNVQARSSTTIIDCRTAFASYETLVQSADVDFTLINETGSFYGVMPFTASGEDALTFTGNFDTATTDKIPLGTELQAGTTYHLIFWRDTFTGKMMVFMNGAFSDSLRLSASLADDDVPELSWNVIEDATSYIVKRSESLGSGYYTVATLPAGRTNYADELSLASDIDYYYKVEDNTGRTSNTVQITIPAGTDYDVLFQDDFNVPLADVFTGRSVDFTNNTLTIENGRLKVQAPADTTTINWLDEVLEYPGATVSNGVLVFRFTIKLPNSAVGAGTAGIGVRAGVYTNSSNRLNLEPQMSSNATWRKTTRIDNVSVISSNTQDKGYHYQHIKLTWDQVNETQEWKSWQNGAWVVMDGPDVTPEDITNTPVMPIGAWPFVTVSNGDVGASADFYALISDIAITDGDYDTQYPYLGRKGDGRVDFCMASGSWDMVAAGSKIVAHGLSRSEVKSLEITSVMVTNDDKTKRTQLGGGIQVADVDDTNINLYRETGGAFDSTDYNSTLVNRAMIKGTYIPEE